MASPQVTADPGADLDLSADVVALTADLVSRPSVSGTEAPLADAVERALRACPHLTVDRDGNSVVARTDTGRGERVVIAGHLDTVPAADNLAARFDGDRLYGLGACDMKGRSEEHTSELQSRRDLVCRLLLEKKKKKKQQGQY